MLEVESPNTHTHRRVLFLSTGGNIRLLQMGVALKHLNHVITNVAPRAPLLFCGDFNSSPDSGNSTQMSSASLLAGLVSRYPMLCVDEGVFQLITEAAVLQQHADWSSSGPDESCSMELLSAFPPFLSACAQPAYTNYVGGFHGCLDYIFIQPDKMQVLIWSSTGATF